MERGIGISPRLKTGACRTDSQVRVQSKPSRKAVAHKSMKTSRLATCQGSRENSLQPVSCLSNLRDCQPEMSGRFRDGSRFGPESNSYGSIVGGPEDAFAQA